MIQQSHSWALSGNDENSSLKRYMHSSVYSSNLQFAAIKTWKQPKCPLADEWIEKKASHQEGLKLFLAQATGNVKLLFKEVGASLVSQC